MSDLDFNCCSFGSLLIVLFDLIHFKWITIHDNEGQQGKSLFLRCMCVTEGCNVEVSGADEGHTLRSNL